MASTSGQQEINTKYPVTEGLIAGTTKQEGTKPYLEPEEPDQREHWGSI